MKLQQIDHDNYRWINIAEPDQEMVNFLDQNFQFHALDLEDLLSKYQHPKIDAYEDYLFIILQFPVFDNRRQIYIRSELNIFLHKEFLITISNGGLAALSNLFSRCEENKETKSKLMGRGTALLMYEVIDALFDNVFPIVNEKYNKIFQLEEDIFEATEIRDVIQDIMILKRNIINLRRIIIPQRSVLLDLEHRYSNFIPEKLNIYFDDIVDKIDKVISQLDTAQAYSDVLEDANETLITRSTNRIIKTLTVFSVVLLPLTLVTSYYGMNVALPGQQNPNVLTIINLALLIIVVIMLLIFYKKRWL